MYAWLLESELNAVGCSFSFTPSFLDKSFHFLF
jgi:hypothetical protein